MEFTDLLNPTLPPLAEKLSDALLQVCEDLKSLVSAGHKFNPFCYGTIVNNVCETCLAGSVFLCRIADRSAMNGESDEEPNEKRCGYPSPTPLGLKLEALDCMRYGTHRMYERAVAIWYGDRANIDFREITQQLFLRGSSALVPAPDLESLQPVINRLTAQSEVLKGFNL